MELGPRIVRLFKKTGLRPWIGVLAFLITASILPVCLLLNSSLHWHVITASTLVLYSLVYILGWRRQFLLRALKTLFKTRNRARRKVPSVEAVSDEDPTDPIPVDEAREFAKKLEDAQDNPSAAPAESSTDDGRTEGSRREDQKSRDETIIATRNWKFFVKHISIGAGLFMVLLSIGCLMVVAKLGFEQSFGATIWAIYVLIVLIAVPIMWYHTNREIFRWKNTLLELSGDTLTYIKPMSRLYYFTGGNAMVNIASVNYIMPKEATFFELYVKWFEHVRSLKADTASTEDEIFHNMKDVNDAEKFAKTVMKRKQVLLRGSGAAFHQ